MCGCIHYRQLGGRGRGRERGGKLREERKGKGDNGHFATGILFPVEEVGAGLNSLE